MNSSLKVSISRAQAKIKGKKGAKINEKKIVLYYT